jgi:TfoX/Sxy family transcriptional regulator of competence genes
MFCTDLPHKTHNTPLFKVQHHSEEAVLDSVIGGSMAYDENLAERVWQAMAGTPGLVEKKMFGGTGYLLHGNMACGVNGSNLIVRVGPQAYQEALEQPGVQVFDLTGRPMSGWVQVTPAGLGDQAALQAWIARGIQFAQSLPPK